MNNKIVTIVFGAALGLAGLTAKAQKSYNEGVLTYAVSTSQGDVESKVYFRGDSSASVMQAGPAQIKLLTTKNRSYFAVAVDVPVASIKKAAVLTPDELDQAREEQPKFSFTPTAETKTISGYNCKKVVAKDPKSGATFDIWVTNDITVAPNIMTMPYADAGGFPVQFTAMQQGQSASFTLKSISDQKAPAGTFAIGKDFDKISYEDLKAMGGNH